MKSAQRRSLFSLYLAYFADYFSWGVAIAYLAIYIGTEQSPFQHLYWNPNLALGIAIACFPLGDFIGSPILGDLSDLIGRRKVLIGGLFGSVVSLAVCALGLWYGWFWLFLLGQLLAGFFGGKQGMAQAAIAEIDTGTKSQKLAFLSVLGGIAWITGPYLGNELLEKPLLGISGLILPSLLSSAVFALCLFYTYFFFEDTYQPNTKDFSSAKFMKGIGQLFAMALRERLVGLFLLNLLGWYMAITSISYFLIQKFNLSHSDVTIYDSYIALCFTLGGILGTAWVLHRFKTRKLLFWMQIAASIGLFSLFGSEKIAELWIYLAVPAITEAVIYPAYQTVLSDHTSVQSQGKMFGLINAMNGACQMSTWYILDVFPADFVGGSILLSALLFLISGVCIPFTIRKKVKALKLSSNHLA